jgi:hypothetical protein
MKKAIFQVSITLAALFLSIVVPVNIQAATNPYGGSAVTPPAPTEVIFTIKNGVNFKKYSMNDLKKMKSRSITIFEPFVKKQQTFQVIKLSLFAQESKISAKARLSTVALNDYVYANTLSNFLKAQAYIAIGRNGKPIPYDEGGPIRIIYPADSLWVKNLDSWNWSLRSIVVK